MEERSIFEFEAGKTVDVLIEYRNTPAPAEDDDDEKANGQPALMRGVVSAY